MPRSARIVIPGLPHHVTQRGNRRQVTFFDDADYALYLEINGDRHPLIVKVAIKRVAS